MAGRGAGMLQLLDPFPLLQESQHPRASQAVSRRGWEGGTAVLSVPWLDPERIPPQRDLLWTVQQLSAAVCSPLLHNASLNQQVLDIIGSQYRAEVCSATAVQINILATAVRLTRQKSSCLLRKMGGSLCTGRWSLLWQYLEPSILFHCWFTVVCFVLFLKSKVTTK